jgi:nicotinamide mononucleotide (NMN) deamidase PncC
MMIEELAALATGPAAALTTAGEMVATVEGTSGGLISAALQSVPRASRFWTGGLYSFRAVVLVVGPIAIFR